MDFISTFIRAGAEAVRKAQEDYLREREAMNRRNVPADDLTEEEQLQMALAMSENEQIQHEREELELQQEADSFEFLTPPAPSRGRAPSSSASIASADHDWALARQMQSQELQGAMDHRRGSQPAPKFDEKIADTSDLMSQEEEAIAMMDETDSDELLARQLQEQEDEVAANAETSTSTTTISSPPPVIPPLSTSPPFILPERWAPPPGPLPIIDTPMPMPILWPGYAPPLLPTGGLTDSQLARRIQDEEDEGISTAMSQPSASAHGLLTEGTDDALARAMEESRREAEEQERRALREEQEREYQETLLMDQIKEREREEEEKRKRREEEEERRIMEEEEEMRAQEGAEHAAKLFSLVLKRDSEIARLEQAVPGPITPELEKTEKMKGRKVCALVIRLANGARLERRFWGDNTLLDVKNFVDLHLLQAARREDEEKQKNEAGEESEAQGEEKLPPLSHFLPSDSYVFVTTYPQKKFANWSETLDEAGLCPRALICVQEETASSGSNQDE